MPVTNWLKYINRLDFEKDNSFNELIGTNVIFGTRRLERDIPADDNYGPYYAGVYEGLTITSYLPNKANTAEPSTKYYIDLSSCHAMSGNCYMWECSNHPDCKHPWEPEGSSEQIFHIPSSKISMNVFFSQDLKLDELMRVWKAGSYGPERYGKIRKRI